MLSVSSVKTVESQVSSGQYCHYAFQKKRGGVARETPENKLNPFVHPRAEGFFTPNMG
jgi:hypothetical protein